MWGCVCLCACVWVCVCVCVCVCMCVCVCVWVWDWVKINDVFLHVTDEAVSTNIHWWFRETFLAAFGIFRLSFFFFFFSFSRFHSSDMTTRHVCWTRPPFETGHIPTTVALQETTTWHRATPVCVRVCVCVCVCVCVTSLFIFTSFSRESFPFNSFTSVLKLVMFPGLVYVFFCVKCLLIFF